MNRNYTWMLLKLRLPFSNKNVVRIWEISVCTIWTVIDNVNTFTNNNPSWGNLILVHWNQYLALCSSLARLVIKKQTKHHVKPFSTPSCTAYFIRPQVDLVASGSNNQLSRYDLLHAFQTLEGFQPETIFWIIIWKSGKAKLRWTASWYVFTSSRNVTFPNWTVWG